MTLDIFFLLVVTIYLVLIAYGIVGGRRRGLSARPRMVSAALIVALPPVAILAALLATGNPFLIAEWRIVTLAMLAGGIVTALLAEAIARRVIP